MLSACETALGRDVRGEGLIGLTRGFMYAGARRVAASLWKVDDAATSEWMKRFYAALRQPGMTPAAPWRRSSGTTSRAGKDVAAFLDRGLVTREELAAYFDAIAPELSRYPALDEASFRRRLTEALGSTPP